MLPFVVVPHICDPVHTCSIDTSDVAYQHLSGLQLADPGTDGNDLQIDLLIGSDHYWRVVTGEIVKGESGPTAIKTLFGWVLSGPSDVCQEGTTINFISSPPSHTLRIDSSTETESLDAELGRFWDLESLGILKEEHPVQERFSQKITFDGKRYEVHLPWKQSHPDLPDNYDLCKKRLGGLLKRLNQNPEELQLYDSIIQEQLCTSGHSRGCPRAIQIREWKTALPPAPWSTSTGQGDYETPNCLRRLSKD